MTTEKLANRLILAALFLFVFLPGVAFSQQDCFEPAKKFYDSLFSQDSAAIPTDVVSGVEVFYLSLPSSYKGSDRLRSVWHWLRDHRDKFKLESTPDEKVVRRVRYGYLFFNPRDAANMTSGKPYILVMLAPFGETESQMERQVLLPLSDNGGRLQIYLPGITINGWILDGGGR